MSQLDQYMSGQVGGLDEEELDKVLEGIQTSIGAQPQDEPDVPQAEPSAEAAPKQPQPEPTATAEQPQKEEEEGQKDQSMPYQEGYDAGDAARTTAETVLSVPTALVDFGVDAINLIPGVGEYFVAMVRSLGQVGDTRRLGRVRGLEFGEPCALSMSPFGDLAIGDAGEPGKAKPPPTETARDKREREAREKEQREQQRRRGLPAAPLSRLSAPGPGTGTTSSSSSGCCPRAGSCFAPSPCA